MTKKKRTKRWDSFWAGLCKRCKGQLTSADYEARECTQCGKSVREGETK